MNTPPSVLLLGIGNVLWADEGFGVRVVEMLQSRYRFPSHVKVLDGGTQGVYLLEHVQETQVLVIFDAIDYDLPPGTLKCLENDDVPHFLGAKKMSLHQTGFQEVLATAQMLGKYPQRLLLVGIQPQELDDYGGSLRDIIKAQIQPAIDQALAYLQQFDIAAEKIQEPETLAAALPDMQRYEQERPSPAEACRIGDARVLHSGAFVPGSPPESDADALQIDVDYRGKYPCA